MPSLLNSACRVLTPPSLVLLAVISSPIAALVIGCSQGEVEDQRTSAQDTADGINPSTVITETHAAVTQHTVVDETAASDSPSLALPVIRDTDIAVEETADPTATLDADTGPRDPVVGQPDGGDALTPILGDRADINRQEPVVEDMSNVIAIVTDTSNTDAGTGEGSEEARVGATRSYDDTLVVAHVSGHPVTVAGIEGRRAQVASGLGIYARYALSHRAGRAGW